MNNYLVEEIIRVNRERFIKTWEESNSRKEVSEKLGITDTCAGVLANKYRKLGIPMKFFSEGALKCMPDEKIKLFITAWETSASWKEVSNKLKISVGAAKKRAEKLRRLGVPLKKFTASNPRALTPERIEHLKNFCLQLKEAK